MFTGIIQTIGSVVALQVTKAQDASLSIKVKQDFAQDAKLGDSISINGVCLTLVEKNITSPDLELCFDLSAHTLIHSNLGVLQPNNQVNLERALVLGERIDGHLVYGHVDNTGCVVDYQRVGDSWWLMVSCSTEYKGLICERGSITVDGVSLTIAGIKETADSLLFDIAIVPYTNDATIASHYKSGQVVNLEFDMLARYLLRQTSVFLNPS